MKIRKKNMPKVSVIVPVYNVEQYIKKCIESLIAQTLRDIEILVVDDGSTDNSAEIIRSFADERVKYLRKENGGPSDARNYGMQFASGEYIGFVDSDDFTEPEMFRLMYESAVQNDSDVVQCAYFKDYESKSVPHYVEERQNEIVKFVPYNPVDKIYKASVIHDSKLEFVKTFWHGEDYNFNLKLSYFVKKVSVVQVPLYHYVQRKGSIMHTVSEKVLDSMANRKDIYDFFVTKRNYDFNDIKWYFAKSACIGDFRLLCKYDAQNGTDWTLKNYDDFVAMFPDWKKSTCLKKKSAVNLYLKCTSRTTVRFVRLLLKVCWLVQKR